MFGRKGLIAFALVVALSVSMFGTAMAFQFFNFNDLQIVDFSADRTLKYARARDEQRLADLQTIAKAMQAYYLDNYKSYEELTPTGDLPDDMWANFPESVMKSDPNTLSDVCDALVPRYLPKMPVDPKTGHYNDCQDYDTGYSVYESIFNGHSFHLTANGELVGEIEVVF